MEIIKRKLSFSIATVLTVAALLIPSISVYAKTTPKLLKSNILSTTSLSTIKSDNTSTVVDPAYMQATSTGIRYSLDNGVTWTIVKLAEDFHGVVYDSVHHEYVGVGNEHITTSNDTYYVGYIYTSTDGINWTKSTLPNTIANVYGIAMDGKGTIVVCANYSIINSNSIYESYMYTSNDGGTTWKETANGSHMYNSNIGTFYGNQLLSETYSNGQFVVNGNFNNVYSSDGYTWHY